MWRIMMSTYLASYLITDWPTDRLLYLLTVGVVFKRQLVIISPGRIALNDILCLWSLCILNVNRRVDEIFALTVWQTFLFSLTKADEDFMIDLSSTVFVILSWSVGGKIIALRIWGSFELYWFRFWAWGNPQMHFYIRFCGETGFKIPFLVLL